jgi:hypothetical protein
MRAISVYTREHTSGMRPPAAAVEDCKCVGKRRTLGLRSLRDSEAL